MSTAVTQLLPQLSDALAAQVAAAAPWVTAIRIGPNRHIAGIVWRADVVVTSDQALPAQDSYSLAGSDGTLLPARAARRDPATNLVCLNLDTPAVTAPMRAAVNPAVGGLALALGAAADGSPTVRLTTIHWVGRSGAAGSGPLGDAIMLDLAADMLPEGGPVLDARGGLLGMASAGPQGEALVIPHATINRFLDPLGMAKTLPAVHGDGAAGWASRCSRSTCRRRCAPSPHQSSGRLVVSVTAGRTGRACRAAAGRRAAGDRRRERQRSAWAARLHPRRPHRQHHRDSPDAGRRDPQRRAADRTAAAGLTAAPAGPGAIPGSRAIAATAKVASGGRAAIISP